MNESGWAAVIIAFLVLEGSIFAAWMNLRDRVTRNESAVCKFREVMEAKLAPLGETLKHLMDEGDETREKVASNGTTISVHEQRHAAAESRLRRLEDDNVRGNPSPSA